MAARRMHTPPHATLVTLLILCQPLLGSGQSVVVDQGTFLITVDGRPTGSEDFVIRRAGAGPEAQMIATGEISLSGPGGRSELRPALQMVGTETELAAYQMKVSGSRDEEVFVTAAEDRFIIRLRSARGEREGELRAAPATLVLDTGVAHHHYFLSERPLAEGVALAVIIPGEGILSEARVIGSEDGELHIAGRTLRGRRIALEIGEGRREVWLDPMGRVLRVADVASGYTALRTSPPGS